jgi:hypothetical protein
MRATRIATFLLFAFATSLAAQTNEAATTANPTVAYAYIGEAANHIGAFAVQKNGSATLVSGSPFPGPSQNIVVSSGFVFGTDGTNIVTYTRTAATGKLHVSSVINGIAHNDTPTGSGVGPLTLDRSGKSLYAAEYEFQGADNDAYAEFGIQGNGALQFQNNTEISVDFHSPLEFSQDNKFAYGYGCYFANYDVFGFQREASGQLVSFNPGATLPLSNDLFCPGAAAVSAKGFLALAYGNSISGSEESIAIFRISTSGDLELITDSITATNFILGFGGLRFDPTGTFLAVAGQYGIRSFRLNANGTLTPLGSVLEPGVTFFDVKWDNASHVYAISSGALYVFTSNGAGLSVTGAPHGLSHAAGSLAVLPVQ